MNLCKIHFLVTQNNGEKYEKIQVQLSNKYNNEQNGCIETMYPFLTAWIVIIISKIDNDRILWVLLI